MGTRTCLLGTQQVAMAIVGGNNTFGHGPLHFLQWLVDTIVMGVVRLGTNRRTTTTIAMTGGNVRHQIQGISSLQSSPHWIRLCHETNVTCFAALVDSGMFAITRNIVGGVRCGVDGRIHRMSRADIMIPLRRCSDNRVQLHSCINGLM